jgi:hypothetical protein
MKMKEICKIPKLPDEIKKAVNGERLAVFIGAGVSRLLGCLGWGRLAENLIKKCFDEKLISFKEFEQLSQCADHKKTITICEQIFNKKNKKELFYDEMKKALENKKDSNIYSHIYHLKALFLTTNADLHFDPFFCKENIFFRERDFQSKNIRNLCLYKIHGSIEEVESLIFTVSKYSQRYTNDGFRLFLQKIFHDFTVLFLGYGLSEFEILDYVLRYDLKNLVPKHFILSPFYKGEENLLNFEESYYNDLNINVIPYEKDGKGYEQLLDVLEEWDREINSVTNRLHEDYKTIDKNLRLV